MINIEVGDLVVSECGVEGVLLDRGWVLIGCERKDISRIESKSKLTNLSSEIYSVTGRIHLKKDVAYIKLFKHMIGVIGKVGDLNFFVGDISESLSELIESGASFFDHNDRLLSYKEYMQLYYPEYEFVWKEQLSEN